MVDPLDEYQFPRTDPYGLQLCGSRNFKELQMNIKAAAEPLDREIVEELNQATQPLLEKLGPSFDYYENPANDRTK
jgi:hypothetical protein